MARSSRLRAASIAFQPAASADPATISTPIRPNSPAWYQVREEHVVHGQPGRPCPRASRASPTPMSGEAWICSHAAS